MNGIYDQGLARNEANYQPLTPLTFLERAATVYPEQTAIIYGDLHVNYYTFYQRCRQLSSSLAKIGISRGDTVSVMLANTPAMLEVHYAVPMCGGVLHALNTRLDASVIEFQVRHAESRVLITDTEFADTISEVLAQQDLSLLVIDYVDRSLDTVGDMLGFCEYENFLEGGDSNYRWMMPADEWDAISVNYTSGTTGNPKGVVYHHRGASLLAQGNVVTTSIPKHAVYLWTLPMFHCNGWCFPWTLSVVTGTHICIREVRTEVIWTAIKNHSVTHLCGAPIVMSIILSADESIKHKRTKKIEFFTAAAPPSESVLTEMDKSGFNVTHLYGLTEVYGPAVANDWHLNWNELTLARQASLKARQGVRYHALEGLEVFDVDTMEPVPRDGTTIGEVMLRGNVVMKGYLKNKLASEEAFRGGWFHSGDLAVIHPDGYIQLKDRSKDIIISGGENISSIEVEEVLQKHPDVSAAAVVAVPDIKWGETPFAFVESKAGSVISENDMMDWCHRHLAHYKVPKYFMFEAIQKTSTGKVQKFELRKRASRLIR